MTQICFIRKGATALFLPNSQGEFGGAEVRVFTFARALSQRGINVDFAMANHPDLPHVSPDGIRVVPLPARQRGLTKFIRSIRGRLSSIPQSFPAIEHIEAPIIACFGVHHPSAQMIAAARAVGKKSILFLTSIEDVAPNTKNESSKLKRNRIQHQYAVQNADQVVVQTESQLSHLKKRFGRDGTLIRNPIDTHIGEDDLLHFRTNVLWVGRADRDSKRADICFELARRCPEIPFRVVMNGGNRQLLRELLESKPANVEVETHVPFEQIERYYKTASVLLNTSVSEGFPNAFLQAMKFRTPIISLEVDPDEVLTSYDCGVVAGSVERMAAILPSYWPRSPLSVSQGRNARDYLVANHALDGRVLQLEELITLTMSDRNVAA